MTSKKQLENNLNKDFGCNDIHVNEVRDVDDNKLTHEDVEKYFDERN